MKRFIGIVFIFIFVILIVIPVVEGMIDGVTTEIERQNSIPIPTVIDQHYPEI